jgi:hypothetical protein
VLGEIRTQEVVSTKNSSIWRTKLFIFGYEEGAGLLKKVFDDIVGDLKIDALYI